MQLTKFTHACVRIDDAERRLVIDPGVFSEVDQALDGVSDVLITHEHPDHIHADALLAAARANSSLRVWAPASLAAALAGLGDRLTTVGPGESFEVAGFGVETFGGQHAVIHPSIPVIANVGYLIDETLYHPGDSFSVPTKPVRTLLAPLHAPWSKSSEVVDFTISVRAPKVIPVHDSLLVPAARTMVCGQISQVAGPHGVEVQLLTPVETVSL